MDSKFFKKLKRQLKIKRIFFPKGSVICINNDDRSFEKLEIVKKYFARIFIVLKKEIRRELLALNLPKEELKEIKKELVFLPEDKQKEYLKELSTKK